MELGVSTVETDGFMPWNWEFQPLKLMVYTVETDGSTCWGEDNLSFDKTENLRWKQFLLPPFKFASTAPVIPMNREMQEKCGSVEVEFVKLCLVAAEQS